MIQALPISDLIDCTPRWKIGGRFVVVVFVLLWMDALSSFLDHLVVSTVIRKLMPKLCHGHPTPNFGQHKPKLVKGETNNVKTENTRIVLQSTSNLIIYNQCK